LRQNWIGAQEVAEAIRKIGNDRGLADQIVGEALAGRGRSAESIGILQSAYENTPGAIQPMFALVRAYLRAQQADRAVTFLQGVLKASPDNAQAHVLLATVYFALDELDKASNSLGTAIKIDPTNTNAYRVLADIHRRRGNLDEAIRIVQAGLALQPNSFGLRLTAASLFEIKGEHEQAISQYEEMLKLDPGSLIAINNLVSLLTDFRTDKESLDRAYSLAPALRKSPLPQFKDTLGWTYYRRGEYRPALALLEEAVAELPSNPLVRYHLGMTYMALEQNPKAIEQFEKALALKTVNEGLEAKIRAAMKKIGSS
jgi:tetratricopeptide (TPR) repeat protein